MGVGFLAAERRRSAAGRPGSCRATCPRAPATSCRRAPTSSCRSTTTATAASRRTARRSACTSPRSRSHQAVPGRRRSPGRFLVHPGRRREASRVTGDDRGASRTATLHSVMPHMHMLGKKIKVTMTPPDGKPQTLLAHQRLGLQLAGDVLLQGADRGEGGHAVRRSRRSTTTAPRTRTTRSTRRGWCASAVLVVRVRYPL